jgi:energy-coupling factor transporter ATP-binding protein EcfA2
MAELVIKDLHVSVEDKEILKGIDLVVKKGERHALIGPNGNGKSTLLAAIMGNPKYTVTQGSITLDGQDVKLQDQLGGGGGTSYSAGTGIDITNDVISVTGKADTSAVTAIQDSLSGYVTTNTEQTISGKKIFTYSATNGKAIEFKQTDDNAKIGFSIKNSAATYNEVASFEFRPNTFTIDNVQHPLMYFGHYRNINTANAGVPQTVIGFRQYDQKNAAAYHYLMPLPEKAKTPFSLTTSFKDYYAPMGFKVDSGGTMVTTDNTGVVDLSSYIGGGGSSYTAGRGISIANDTISFSLPIFAGTGTNSIEEGSNNSARGSYSHAEGMFTNARDSYSHSEGYSTYAEALYSHVEGQYTTANNQSEHASGQFNISSKANNTFGDSGNTLFSVGNGTSNNSKHNAFEIRQNGDIYLNDGTNDVKLQDTITATAANTTALGGLSLIKLTQAQYDALVTKDNSTLYVIVN